MAWGVYAALLVAMVVWSLWEVGLDRWALISRGALLAIVGLWLLAPWIDRSLGAAGTAQALTRSSWRGPRGWLAGRRHAAGGWTGGDFDHARLL